MGKGYIVRRGGGGDQTVKPIFNSVVSAGFTSITVNIENDDNSEAVLYYSVVNADPGPDQVDTFEITLDGRTADDATITGLTANSSYVLYIKAFALGKSPSDIVTVINQLQTASPIVATGGTITNYSDAGVDYRVHTFTGNGTFAVSNASVAPFNQVDYLIVAGGGGGATQANSNNRGGGAGGAGGLLSGQTTPTVTNYSIVVGAGGNRADTPYYSVGTSGANSSAFSLTAIGGGRGGHGNGVNGLTGGSGGGGGAGDSPTTGAAGTAGQGFAGGSAAGTASTNGASGAGGGGAGGAGSNTAFGVGSQTAGGPGATSSISGTSIVYSRGGYASGTASAISASNKTRLNNSGDGGNSGGGLTTDVNERPAPGGSGIVIVRYVVGGTV